MFGLSCIPCLWRSATRPLKFGSSSNAVQFAMSALVKCLAGKQGAVIQLRNLSGLAAFGVGCIALCIPVPVGMQCCGFCLTETVLFPFVRTIHHSQEYSPVGNSHGVAKFWHPRTNIPTGTFLLSGPLWE